MGFGLENMVGHITLKIHRSEEKLGHITHFVEDFYLVVSYCSLGKSFCCLDLFSSACNLCCFSLSYFGQFHFADLS